jgi:hypothetical protein
MQLGDVVFRSPRTKQEIRVGQSFGKWTVNGRAPAYRRAARLLCTCSCGASALVRTYRLLTGTSTQCMKCYGLASIGRIHSSRERKASLVLAACIKACSICKEDKPLNEFNRCTEAEALTGYRGPCKVCFSDARRKYKYGLDATAQHALLELQQSRCALCFATIDKSNSHLDHDHTTGLVRGFLCKTCNAQSLAGYEAIRGALSKDQRWPHLETYLSKPPMATLREASRVCGSFLQGDKC